MSWIYFTWLNWLIFRLQHHAQHLLPHPQQYLNLNVSLASPTQGLAHILSSFFLGDPSPRTEPLKPPQIPRAPPVGTGLQSGMWLLPTPGSGALCKTQGLPSIRTSPSLLSSCHCTLLGLRGYREKVSSVSAGVLVRNLPLPQGRMKLSFHVSSVFRSLSVSLLSLESYF